MSSSDSSDAEDFDKPQAKVWTAETERDLVETLIDLSENRTNKLIRRCHDDLGPWLATSANLQYSQTQGKKKTKLSRERSPNTNSANKKTVNDWPGSLVENHVPEWKLCVETRTYRYIPNNGKYRTSKLTKKLEIHRNVKHVTEKMTPEQKYLQKEIQRELRREFELIKNRSNCVDEDQVIDLTNKTGSTKCEKTKDYHLYLPQEVVNPERKLGSRGRVEDLIDLPPITVPLVVGKNMLYRQSAGSVGMEETPEIFRHRQFPRGSDPRLHVRSLSEPPNRKERVVSPQALTYETFSIKQFGKNNKHRHHVFNADENQNGDLSDFRKVPLNHQLKEITVTKKGIKHQSRKLAKYQFPTTKQIQPLPMDKDILTGKMIDDSYVDIPTLATKNPHSFIPQVLPEIMGRKINGFTQDTL